MLPAADREKSCDSKLSEKGSSSPRILQPESSEKDEGFTVKLPPILRLPPELLQTIIDYVDDKDDA